MDALFSTDPTLLTSKKRSRPFTEIPFTEVQEFWDAQPCNLHHSRKLPGSKEYFDEVEKRKYFVEPHIPPFASFSEWKGKRVLEVGAGLGTEAVNFARAGALVTVVELSPRSLELCQARFALYNLPGKFIQGNAEELNSLLGNEEKFDLIWAFGTIHHTPHPSRVIHHFKDLLAVGGEARVMVYSKVSYKLFFLMRQTGLWDFGKMDLLVSEYAEAQTGCPVAYTFTFDQIRKLFQDFDILELRKAHIFPWKIPEYKQHQYVKEECWEGVDDETFRELEAELGWHTLVRVSRKQMQ